MSLPIIQSISVPSYSTATPTASTSSSKPYINYQIQISTPSRTYSIERRYSSFVQLVHDLQLELNAKPPFELPSKTSGLLSLFGRSGLSDDELIERRKGLERFLRGLLSCKDSKWLRSRSFSDFISSPLIAAGGGGGEAEERMSSIEWMNEQQALNSTIKELRSLLSKRDAFLASRNHQAHSINQQVKKGLVQSVSRLGALTKSLKRLAEEGLPQGELNRRKDMIDQLQDELETLGKMANTLPRISASTLDSQKIEEPISVQRSSLLGGNKPAARVLGTSSKPVETNETRPLDNQGLLQLQQQHMQNQDQQLDALTVMLRRQRVLGEMISDELSQQEELLDTLDKGLDRTGDKLKNADKLMKKL